MIVRWSREVIAQRVVLIAAVAALLHVAVAFAWITPDLSGTVESGVTKAIDGLGVLIAFFSARSAVTPSDDPRNADGEPLIAMSVHQAAVDAARLDAVAALNAVTEHKPEHAAPEA